MAVMLILHKADGDEDLPAIGANVLAWDEALGGSWQVARFRGRREGRDYAWDFDTYGLSQENVRFWYDLPPDPTQRTKSG